MMIESASVWLSASQLVARALWPSAIGRSRIVPKLWISIPFWCSRGWLDPLPPLERLRASNGSPDLRCCCLSAIDASPAAARDADVQVDGGARLRFAGNRGPETALAGPIAGTAGTVEEWRP